MSEVSTLRLYLLRGMYLLIAVGLGITIWPWIVAPPDLAKLIVAPSDLAIQNTVVRALLGGLAVVSLLGVRYPLKMLPVLLFELLWKLIWVIAFGLRMWLANGLDARASSTLFACLLGVVLVPIVMPWGYVFRHYVRAAAEPWRRPSASRMT